MATTKVSGNLIQAATVTGNNIATGTITTNNISTSVNLGGPKITTITYPGDDTAADTAGGQTVVLTGNGFATGASVLMDGVAVGSVTVTNTTSISFTSPAKSTGSYIVYVVNTDGSTAILVPGIQYSGLPTYSTSAGSLGTAYEYAAVSSTIAATGDAPVTFSLYSGSLPDGVTLASNGQLSGTTSAQSGNTTFSFTVRATDAQNQETDRNFSITINMDAVTWSAPANNATITTYEYTAISNTFAATSAAGRDIVYTANTLPANVTITGSTVSGTPTTVGNTTSLITATSNTTNRTADRTLNFVVQQDVVTWSSPANNVTYTWAQNVANTTGLAATSAAGKSITFAANSLPTGLAVSGNTITGTPTAAGNSSSLITATAATTNRTAVQTINWVIQLAGDIYWNSTSLLVGGSGISNTFINDASLNNNQLTVVGDTKPNNFNPHQSGYYSNYFDGSGDSLDTTSTTTQLTFGNTTNFTIEAWVYPLGYNQSGSGPPDKGTIWSTGVAEGGSARPVFGINSSGKLVFGGWNSLTATGSTTIPLNTWSHVAVTFDGTTYKLFYNGALDGTSTTILNFSTTPLTGTVGSNPDGTYRYPYYGYISNLRVLRGTALYTSAFTPPTGPLTAIANTVMLTCQSNRLIDNSLNNFALTKNGDTAVSSAHPFATPTTSSYNTQYSTQMNGSGNYVSVPGGNAGFAFGTGDLTIEGWVYWKSGTAFTLFDNRTGATTVNIAILLNSTTISVYIGGSSFVINGSTFATNQWYHIALVRISGSMKLYINGTQAGSTYASSQNFTSVTGPVCIGGGYPSGTNSPLVGYISNVRVVKGLGVYTGNFTPPTSALTATQSSGTNISAITAGQTVLLTCQDSTGRDNSSSAQVVAVNGTAQPIAVSPFTMTTSNTTVTSLGSAYFDGTGDYLSIPASPAFTFTGDFTIDAWVYPTALGADNCIISQWTSSLSFIVKVVTGNRLYFAAYPGSIVTQGTTTTVPLNQWSYIVVTRTGTTIKLFVNGVQDATTGTVSGSLNASTTAVTIGSLDTSPTQMWTGYISDLRTIKGTALYTSNFLPPQAPLTPVANTQLLTLQYNGGATNNGFVDQSRFNNIITRNGNTTQGTFSPFSQTGWSVYVPTGNPVLASANSSNLVLGTGDWTIEAWINLATVPTTTAFYIFSNRRLNDASWTDGPMACITNSKLYVRDGNGSFLSSTPTTFVANRWYHIAVCRSGNSIACFIDGVQEGTSYNVSIGGTYTGNTIRVGYEQQFGTTASDGYVSNLRVVKGTALYTSTFPPSTTPLSTIANTQLLICNTPTCSDVGPNVLSITKPDTITVQAYSPFGGVTSVPTSYSNYFDGTGDYLTVPDNTAFNIASNNLTIESWIYPTSIPAQAILFCKTPNSSSYGSFEIRLNTNGTVLVYVSANGSTWDFNFTSSNAVNINAWNHISLTRTTGGLYTIWINGVSGATYTWNFSMWNSTHAIAIGAYGNGANPFTGYMSNARIVNGTALYTTSFTPSTIPLTTTSQGATASNVSLLTCQSATTIDNSPNYFTITANGNTTPKPFNPFGTTTTTNVSYTPSVNGGSMYFDGTGDYLTAGTFAPGTRDFTVEFWMYPTALPGSGSQAIIFATPWGGSNFQTFLNNDSTFQWQAYSAAPTATSIKVNQWQHVAVTRVGTTGYMYIDGVLRNTASMTTNISGTAYVGARGADALYYTGYITDLRTVIGSAIYTSNFYPGSAPATPTTQIGTTTYSSSLLLNGTSGGIIDAHGTNDLETVGNTQLAGEDPYSSGYYSNYSDGDSDYLTVPSASWSTLAGAFTLEYWIRWNIAPASAGTITGVYSNGGLTCYNDGTRISPNIFGSGNIFNSTFLTSSIVPGKWYHIAVTRNSSNLMTMWVDGVSVGSTTTATTYTQGTWYIFSMNNTNLIQGNISNLRINNTCLYTSAFTPSTTPLTAVSGTQLLTCQSNRFKDNSTNAATLTPAGTVAVKSLNPFQQNTGKSLYFGTKTDYLAMKSIPSIANLPGDFTIECWVNPTDTSISTTWGILDARAAGASASAWLICLSSYSSGWLMNMYTGTSYSGTTRIQANQWTHCAWVRSGSTLTFYVNGVAGGTATVSGAITGGTTTVWVGSKDNGLAGYGTIGYIKDLRFTQGVARYTSTFTPPIEPLIAK